MHDYHPRPSATTVIYTQDPFRWNPLFQIPRHAVKTLKQATQHKVNSNNFFKTYWLLTCAVVLEYRRHQAKVTNIGSIPACLNTFQPKLKKQEAQIQYNISAHLILKTSYCNLEFRRD